MKELNFYLSKKSFEDGLYVNKAKLCLYAFINSDELIELMKENGISINKKEILDKYVKCFNMDDVLTYFNIKLNKELNELESKFILLDGDCIYFLIDILIKENYDIYDLPDPSYIMETADNIRSMDDDLKPKYFLRMLKSINGIKEYDKERDLNKIFESYCNIEDDISDCSCMRFTKKIIKRSVADKIGDQLEEMADYYKLYDQKYPYSLAMEFKGLYGYSNIKNLFEKCLQKFPESKVRFYFDAITSIPENDKMRKKLIDEILKFEIKTDEDEMYITDLQEWIEEAD